MTKKRLIDWPYVIGPAPIALSWWILVAVFTARVMVYRRMGISRQKMFER